MRTWHAEMAVVAIVLGAVVLGTHARPIEWVGSAAVLMSFAHGQVSDRLAEKEAKRASPEVDCYRWSRRYFLAKEMLWVAYFAAIGSYSALAGCGLFLVYPAWRMWHRAAARAK